MNTIKTKQNFTFNATIFIAGDRNIAEEVCRCFCDDGACVSIRDTKFIYTHGEETGVEITFINYPRFPSSEKEITEKAIKLARELIIKLHQSSCSVVTSTETYWLSRRKE